MTDEKEENIEFSENAIDTEGNIVEGEIEEPKEELAKIEEPKEETSKEEGEVKEKEIGFSDFLKERGIDLEEVASKTKIDGKEKKPIVERDYSDIPESEHEIWKKMSNETFNKLKPIYLEHGKLKQQVEDLKKVSATPVYGHPKAYALTEEYEQRVTDAQMASSVLRHWQMQLAKIRRGEPWKDLNEDEKTGKFVLSEEKEATAEAETEVLQYLSDAQEQNHKFRKDLQDYVEKYSSKYTDDFKILQDAQEKYFPGYKDPKHPTSNVQKAVIEALPLSFRNDPLAPLLAMTAANNAILMGKLQAMEKEMNKIKGIKTDAEKAPPTSRNFVNSGGKKSGEFGTVKYSDFQRARDEE